MSRDSDPTRVSIPRFCAAVRLISASITMRPDSLAVAVSRRPRRSARDVSGLRAVSLSLGAALSVVSVGWPGAGVTVIVTLCGADARFHSSTTPNVIESRPANRAAAVYVRRAGSYVPCVGASRTLIANASPSGSTHSGAMATDDPACTVTARSLHTGALWAGRIQTSTWNSFDCSPLATATNFIESRVPAASGMAVQKRFASIGCVPSGANVPWSGGSTTCTVMASPSASVQGARGLSQVRPAGSSYSATSAAQTGAAALALPGALSRRKPAATLTNQILDTRIASPSVG